MEYNEEMEKEFATTIRNDEEMVKGLRINSFEAAIVEVSSLPRIGEIFLVSPNPRSARDEFTFPNEVLQSTSQGTTHLFLL